MTQSPSSVQSLFNTNVLGVAAPAVLQHAEWTNNEEFVAALCASWQAQYADYIGEPEALTLVGRLLHSGEILAHEPTSTLVAVFDEQHAGIASIRQLDGISLITVLEVLDEYRGQGIGRQLIEALATVNTPLLAHVSIHRPKVKTFYESLGFQALQRSTVDHYEHALLFDVMVRREG